jgi:hypothetical protein
MSRARSDAGGEGLLSNTKSVTRTLFLGIETMRGKAGFTTAHLRASRYGGHQPSPDNERRLVPEEGVEPSRPEGHGILSPARLPVSPLRQRMKPSFYRTSSFRAELLTFAARRAAAASGFGPTRRRHERCELTARYVYGRQHPCTSRLPFGTKYEGATIRDRAQFIRPC